MKKVFGKIAAVGLLMGVCGGIGACSYGGLAATPDGTVYVSRNDHLLFGLLRKVYACKAAEGGSWNCSEVAAP